MILCKKNDKIFIFTVHWRIIYVVSENRNICSVGGGGSFGKPAPGMTLPTIMWDQVGMGKGLPYCTGVSAWFGCLWHALYTHNLCWATANKGQGFARHRIGGVPEVCLFYQPRSIFFCDVNFFSSRNNLSEFSVPVQYALLLVKTFGDM